MFDIGIWELCLIAVVALLVVGPERLPRVAFEAGKLFGKLQRFVRNARMELEREFHNYEIKQTIAEQKEQLKDLATSAEQAGKAVKEELQKSSEQIPGAQTKVTESSNQAENNDK